MDFRSALDMIESFAVGLVILIVIAAVVIISFFIWSFIPQLLKSIPGMMMLALEVIIFGVSIILIGIAVYYVGKFAKKPFKRKMTIDSSKEGFCKYCGKKLPKYAEFCDSCGFKLN